MKKVSIIFLSTIVDILFSFFCYAEWVDADGAGRESVHVYHSMNALQLSFDLNSLGQPGIAFSDGTNLNYLYYNGSAWVEADGSGQ
jgi:hypothetical protein